MVATWWIVAFCAVIMHDVKLQQKKHQYSSLTICGGPHVYQDVSPLYSRTMRCLKKDVILIN